MLKEAASLLRNFLPSSFVALTLLSLNLLGQNYRIASFTFKEPSFFSEIQTFSNNDVINV